MTGHLLRGYISSQGLKAQGLKSVGYTVVCLAQLSAHFLQVSS